MTNLVRTVDVDGSGTLSFPEFIFFMRLTHRGLICCPDDSLHVFQEGSRTRSNAFGGFADLLEKHLFVFC